MMLQKSFVILFLTTVLYLANHPLLVSKAESRATLKADINPVKKWKDTLYYYKSKLRTCRYAKIPVSLSNNTSDTLRYVNMSCSWVDAFTTNINEARIFQDGYCFKNGPVIFKIPPYGNVRFNVPVYFFAGNSLSKLDSKDFKIGMGFFEYTGKVSLTDNIAQRMTIEKSKIIWSNTITTQ